MLSLTLALSNYCMNREGTITINVSVVYMAGRKLEISGPTPSNGPSNGFAPIKTIKSKRYIKNRKLVILCT
jgi:hypothetical protein